MRESNAAPATQAATCFLFRMETFIDFSILEALALDERF